MNNIKKISANYIFNFTYQILLAIAPLITAPYVARVLGPDIMGINTAVTSYALPLKYIAMVGIGLYGIQKVAQVRDSIEERSKVFFELLFILFIANIISTLIYFIFIWLTVAEQLQFYFILGLPYILSSLFDISWFFQGMERFKNIVIMNMISKIISIVCIFIFVKTADDIGMYIFIVGVSLLLGNGLLWVFLPKVICLVKVSWASIVRHFKKTFAFFIPQLAAYVYVFTDKPMILWLYNSMDKMTESGYYDWAMQFSKTFLFVTTTLGTVLLPNLSYQWRDEVKEQSILDKIFPIILYISVAMTFGIIATSEGIIGILLGAAYQRTGQFLMLCAVMIIPISISSNLANTYFIPLSKVNIFTWATILGGVCGVAVNFLLIPSLGGWGAIIGALTAEFIIMIYEIVYIHRNGIKVSELFHGFWQYLIAGMIMLIAIYGIQLLPFGGITSLVLQVVSGMAVYIICNLFFKNSIQNKIMKVIVEKIKARLVK